MRDQTTARDYLRMNPDAEIRALRDDPTSPTWVRKLIPELVERDIVDVTTALEHLAGAFRRRLEAATANYQGEPRPSTREKQALAAETHCGPGFARRIREEA